MKKPKRPHNIEDRARRRQDRRDAAARRDERRTCDVEYTVSDGDPSRPEFEVHAFPCGEPAVAVIVLICEHGADEIPLCAEHLVGGL